MRKLSFVIFLSFLATTTLRAADLFWVGGTGAWSDNANHWSATSGGAPGAAIPGVGDNAIFDGNSGIIATDIVDLDLAIDITDLDFSSVAANFTFNSPAVLNHIIDGSLISNVAGANFTGTWGNIEMSASLPLNSITSGATIWAQNFEFTGTSITINDDFNIGTNSLTVTNGGIIAVGKNITCGDFLSNVTSVRTISIDNSNITVSSGVWTIDPTNLVFSATGSDVSLGNVAGVANFTGGGLPYDTLRSNANTLNYFGNNTFSMVDLLASSNLLINNGDSFSTDSLSLLGTCLMPAVINTIGAGVNGNFIYTGGASVSFQNYQISNIDAIAPAIYNLTNSDTLNAVGWTFVGADFYWIGGTGNWNDPLHWSFSSGGPSAGCLPSTPDNTIFDAMSGIIATDIISLNVPVSINSIDFSGVPTQFTFDSPALVTVQFGGSITSNVAGALFTGTWGEIEMLAVLPGNSIQSESTVWVQDFRFSGNQVAFVDNFNSGTNDIYTDNGGVNSNGFDITCGSFISNTTNTRNLNLDNSQLLIQDGYWEIDSTNLTFSANLSEISLNNTATVATFIGGNQVYDTLISVDALTFNYYDNNSFSYIEFVSSSVLSIENSDTLYADSISMNGTCSSPMTLNTIGVGLNGNIVKTGYSQINLSSIQITNVDAVAPGTYNVSMSDTTNSLGWTKSGVNLYWISDAGNWTDGNHWSLSSGGTASGCVPTELDSVFFDANSFSITGQDVLVDNFAFFKAMDWTGIIGAQTLSLDSSMSAYGDVILNANMSLLRNVTQSGIRFYEQADLNPNLAPVDCNIWLFMTNPLSSVDVQNNLVMSDSSNVILFNGRFNTLGNELKTGNFVSINNPTDGSDQRRLDLGSSNVQLYKTFNTSGDTTFTFNSGTSNIYIGDTLNFKNVLSTEGLTFYDVTLNFQPATDQIVKGNNNFNKLAIIAGSEIYIDSNSILTVNDSLIMKGNCRDSIFISTSDTVDFSTNARINKTGVATNVVAECLNLSAINASGLALTALFSTNVVTSPNWTFNASPGVTTTFTVDGPFCFGDTTLLTNSSTAFSGNSADIIATNWYFNDGSTGYYLNPPTDSTWITSVPDTNRHVFLQHDSINVVLENTYKNFCVYRDTIKIDIVKPNISLLTSEPDTTLCPWESVTHEASSAVPGTLFEFYYNGVSQNTPSTIDTLFTLPNFNNLDTVSVLAYEGICVSDTIPAFIYVVHPAPTFSWTSSDADTSICIGDLVSFTASSANPTNTYRYLINNSGVSPWSLPGLYSTSALLDNDVVSLVARDTNNCLDSISMIFNVDPLPVTVLSESTGGNVICENESVTFTGSGADNFEFYVNGVSVQGPSATATYTTTALTVNDTVSVLGINNNGCEQLAPERFYYFVNPLPAMTFTVDDLDSSICSGTTVTFTAGGAATYQFFNGATSVQGPGTISEYTTNSLMNNDIITVVGDLGGCTATSSNIQMEVFASPTTTLTNNDNGDNTICYGTSVTFTANGAATYEFFVDGTSQGPASATNTFTTTTLTNGQTIRVDGISNSCLVSQQQTFTVLVNPTVNLFSNDTDNTICDGDPITFTGTNASQYEFFINGVSVQGPSTTTTLVNPSIPVSAINPVYVIGTASNGCTNTSSTINVVVNPIPTITLTSNDADNIICAGQPVTFTGAGGSMYRFFVSGIPQGSLSPTSTFTTSSLLNGQTVTVFGSALGCTSTSSPIVMTVNALPNMSLSSDDANNIFCEDEIVTFTANGATNYEFIVNGSSFAGPSPTNNINSTGFPTGTYAVQVIGETNNCFSNANLNITVNGLPTATLISSDADNTICAGQSVTYTASGGALYEFFVNGVSQGVGTPTATFSTTALVNNDPVGVTVLSAQGCADYGLIAPITVNPTPVVTLSSDDVDETICVGTNVNFSAVGATNYTFYINGVSQGASSPTNTLSTSTLTNNANILVVGESNGCVSNSNSLTFTVYGPPSVVLLNNGDLEICTGENTDLTALGSVNYQFFVNGLPSGPIGPVNTFNSPLNNMDVVTVLGESNGCSSMSATSFTYVVYDYPTITSSTNNGTTICKDDNVDITASGAMTYDFFLNGLLIQSGVNNVLSISTLENGDVIDVVGYNGDCASAQDSYTFNVNTMNLTLDIAPSSMICEGDNAVFTATGADLYEFYLNGASVTGMTATNTYSNSSLLDGDQISVYTTNNTTLCNQWYSDYILININDQPTVNSTTSLTFCEGDSVVLYSNSSYGNQWYLNGAPIVGATDTSYTAYISGDYSLETTSGGTGSVWSFGQNANGTFGDGSNLNNSEPTIANTTQAFKFITTGYGHILGLNTANELYAWGKNNAAQLGNGTFTPSNIPLLVPTITNVKTMAAAELSSMAVLNTGELYVWGSNTSGQLGTGNTAVINFPFLNTLVNNVDTIAAGKNHYIVLKTDGTVWTVGNNAYGQLGLGNLINTMVFTQVPTLSNIVTIGTGEYHSFAIDNNGDLYAWGNNGSGQLGLNDIVSRNTPTLTPIKRVIAAQGGASHSAFLTSDEEVLTCGANTFGQMGTGNYDPSEIPVKVALTGVNMISAGQYSTLVKRKDNSVFGFGNNTEDQLSSGNGLTINTPEHISDLDGVVFIEAGRYTSHVIYGETNSCVSSNVTVDAMAVPVVTITSNIDTFTTITGASYQWYFNGNMIPGANSQIYEANESGNYYVEVTFANGCTGTSAIIYHSMSGIKDIVESQLKLFPNPTSSDLTIIVDKLQGNALIQIVDQMGRIVIESKENFDKDTHTINLESIQSGVYQIVIKTDNQNWISRFVKNNY